MRQLLSVSVVKLRAGEKGFGSPVPAAHGEESMTAGRWGWRSCLIHTQEREREREQGLGKA